MLFSRIGRIAQAEFGKQAKERDRKDRHRNGRAHRHADFEHEIKRRRAEDHPEQRADDERQRRQLAQPRMRRNERTEVGEDRIRRARTNDIRQFVRRISWVDFNHWNSEPSVPA